MRDPLTTRRLLAKIDREADLFVVADRMRQAIYDLDDYTGRLDARINALEQERVKFITDTGLNRKLEVRADSKTAKLSRKAIIGLLGLAGTATSALLVWLLNHIAWK